LGTQQGEVRYSRMVFRRPPGPTPGASDEELFAHDALSHI